MPKVADKWNDLAIQFEFDEDGSQIRIIHRDHAIHGVEECCTEAFTLWLRGKGKEHPTWERLICYLEDIERGALAQELREQFSGRE